MKRKCFFHRPPTRTHLMLFAVFVIVLIAALTACGGASSPPGANIAYNETTAAAATVPQTAQQAAYEYAYDYDMSEVASGGGGSSIGDDGAAVYADAQNQQVRKEIKNVHCGLLVKDVRATYNNVANIVNSLGGYEFNKSESQRGGYVYYNLTIKLPPERLDEFERQLRSSAGENAISYYNIYSEDITSAYYDVAARLDSMRASMAQYLSLIERAENVTEMLEIRREITILQAEIDSLQGQINVWNLLIGYATIDLIIEREADPISQTRNAQWTFNTPSEIINSMGNGFIATGNAVYLFIIGFFVVLVSLLPALIPAAIIVFFILWLRRNRKKRKQAISAADKAGAYMINADKMGADKPDIGNSDTDGTEADNPDAGTETGNETTPSEGNENNSAGQFTQDTDRK